MCRTNGMISLNGESLSVCEDSFPGRAPQLLDALTICAMRVAASTPRCAPCRRVGGDGKAAGFPRLRFAVAAVLPVCAFHSEAGFHPKRRLFPRLPTSFRLLPRWKRSPLEHGEEHLESHHTPIRPRYGTTKATGSGQDSISGFTLVV